MKVLDGHVPVAPATSPLPSQFVAAFASFDNIEYHHSVTLNSVNLAAKTLNTSMGPNIPYHVANVIPPQKANLDFAKHPTTGISIGLITAGQKFASVNPQTFESTIVPRIYIIGDASFVPLPTTPPTSLPKSGNIAADQAKIVASVITRRIAGINALEASLAVSAVQFNAIRSTSGHTAVYAHNGFQFNGTGWVASGAFLNANGTDSNAGVSASGAVPASTQIYNQGLTWVDTLHDDCYK